MRIAILNLSIVPPLLIACAGTSPDPDSSRPKMVALARIENLESCGTSGTDFAKFLGHSLAESKRVLVADVSDTSAFKPKPPRAPRPQQGGPGGPEGGMGGGMGGHHGSGGKGRHADENSAGAPVPPMRYRLLGSLGWETDSLGSRSVNKLDTASPMRIPIAQLRLVDESTGRAVWKQAVKIDSMSMPMGTCPQAAQWNRLAGKASDQALSGMFGTKAP